MDFWTSHLITCPVHLSASTSHSCTNEGAHCSSHRYRANFINVPLIVHGKERERNLVLDQSPKGNICLWESLLLSRVLKVTVWDIFLFTLVLIIQSHCWGKKCRLNAFSICDLLRILCSRDCFFFFFPEAAASHDANKMFYSEGQGNVPSAHISKNCQWDLTNFLAQVDIECWVWTKHFSSYFKIHSLVPHMKNGGSWTPLSLFNVLVCYVYCTAFTALPIKNLSFLLWGNQYPPWVSD